MLTIIEYMEQSGKNIQFNETISLTKAVKQWLSLLQGSQRLYLWWMD